MKFDIDVLMVVGTSLAAAIGHPEEIALLLFLFVLSGAGRPGDAAYATRSGSTGKLMPSEARLLHAGRG